ncbi:unnamed protein product [Adineta ricciae]|uniref:Uncharacterized protein n=1 Tax=Adineta ricciae TaxID=249248 RepID=A0A813NGZ3_ADIRI|nr:unnamed protein product [Adineta ricciae]CAF1496769.1 unnamed protein product [Adineta ricciae]
MDKSTINRSALNVVTNQPARKPSNQNDLLAKIRPKPINKPNLVQQLTQSTTIQVSSGLKILNTRIQSNADPSYQPLVMISDDDDDDNHSNEEDFVSPVHRLTRNELREELRAFRQHEDSTNNSTNHALLANGNDDDDDGDVGDIEFRTHQVVNRTVCCSQNPFSCRMNSCVIS